MYGGRRDRISGSVNHLSREAENVLISFPGVPSVADFQWYELGNKVEY